MGLDLSCTTSPDISIFGSYPVRGGVQRQMANVIKVWTDQGLRVEIISFRNGVCFYPEEITHRVSFVDLQTRSKWTTLIALWRHLRRSRPAIVMSTAHLANTILARLGYLPETGARRFVSVPNTFGQSRKRQGRAQSRKLAEVRRLYQRTDGVIAVSNGVKRDLVETIGVTGVPVHCVFNGVVTQENLRRASESVDHPWLAATPDKIPVVITVGRLAPQKDHTRLIEAVARLRADRAVRLIILGDGPLRARLLEIAARHEPPENWLALPGFVDNPFAWMTRSDVFVLSSIWEGFGNVLAEAMGLGVPVVSTDCPSGPADMLDGGRFGHLVPIEDTDALTHAIRRTLDGDTPSFDTAEAVSEFTAETAARRYLEVFELNTVRRRQGRQ